MLPPTLMHEMAYTLVRDSYRRLVCLSFCQVCSVLHVSWLCDDNAANGGVCALIFTRIRSSYTYPLQCIFRRYIQHHQQKMYGRRSLKEQTFNMLQRSLFRLLRMLVVDVDRVLIAHCPVLLLFIIDWVEMYYLL